MSPTHDKPEVEFPKWFRDLCREAGLRATPQRIEILHEVRHCAGHPSAEEVYRRLRRRLPTVSLDTVYRTLALFESHGILARLWGPDGRCRFDPNRAPHHHLMCRRCYQIKDFMWPGFDELGQPPGASQWGEVSRVQVVVHGLCAECLRRGTLEGKGRGNRG